MALCFQVYMICPTDRTEKCCPHGRNGAIRNEEKGGKEHCPILRKACIIYCATKQPTWETTRCPLYAYAWCFVCVGRVTIYVCVCAWDLPLWFIGSCSLFLFLFFSLPSFFFFFLSHSLTLSSREFPNLPPLLLPFIILLLSWLIVLSDRHITTSQN